MHGRELILLCIVVVIIGMIYVKIYSPESFRPLNYGNFPRRLTSGPYRSWGNTFYSSGNRSNIHHRTLPGVITNVLNAPLPYNVHTGQTINVAKTEGIHPVGCPIDMTYDPEMSVPGVALEESLPEEEIKLGGQFNDESLYQVEGFDNGEVIKEKLEDNNISVPVQSEPQELSSYSNLLILGLLLLLFLVALYCPK